MNVSYTEQEFERSKNRKALGITLAICLLLFLLMFLVSWTAPQTPPPVVDNGIEVNLGNSDAGLGTVAPQMQGEMSKEEETSVQPPKAVASHNEPDESKDVAENNDKNVPEIHTSPKPKTEPKHEAVISKTKPKQKEQMVVATPAPPKPKALYKGGATQNNSGGNGADSYNNVRNQGIAGGRGDQGKPNGSAASDSYTGNGGTGKGGVSIRSGLSGRHFTRLPSFTDDFNENAKVAVDITVNASGNVIDASINPRGTTTTSQSIRGIALSKAKQLKLNTGTADEQTGTIVFDFKLRG
ncbi:MAG: hypothetical protein M3R72_00715 [Bacteroidota bacterium]|nr:hypothetical protein [Bacteroidota bacterium]